MNIGKNELGEMVANIYSVTFDKAYESGFDIAIRQVQSIIKRDFKDLKNVSVEDLCKHIEKCFKKEG